MGFCDAGMSFCRFPLCIQMQFSIIQRIMKYIIVRKFYMQINLTHPWSIPKSKASIAMQGDYIFTFFYSGFQLHSNLMCCICKYRACMLYMWLQKCAIVDCISSTNDSSATEIHCILLFHLEIPGSSFDITVEYIIFLLKHLYIYSSVTQVENSQQLL